MELLLDFGREKARITRRPLPFNSRISLIGINGIPYLSVKWSIDTVDLCHIDKAIVDADISSQDGSAL